MEQQTLFFNRLKPGIAAEDYERWVRERDYPTARALSTIVSYEILRLDKHGLPNGDDVSADYLEIVTVTSFEDYDAQLKAMPDREAFLVELRSYVECALKVRSQTI